MALTSNLFIVFFAITVAAFFAVPPRLRWIVLLIASTCFYISFIPGYLVLLLAIVLLNYLAARWIAANQPPQKRCIFILTLAVNLAILVIFKYFNFLTQNLQDLAGLLHWNYALPQLALLLPIGLSFQIFQVLSYVIDVYQQRQPPEEHLGLFAASIIFFPTLLSGPIERPTHLLKQLHTYSSFDYHKATQGLVQMTWGFFKKLVIADWLAPLVSQVYGNPKDYPGISLILATVLFALQLYYDFSGYSDIVIGAARVLGFDLVPNFNRPYWAASISDFWRRWHMSLSSWVRDYLYFPLTRSLMTKSRGRYPRLIQLIVPILIMALIGLWHGANWTFIAWGALFGIYLGVESVFRSQLSALQTHIPPALSKALSLVVTFGLVCLAWIFFRANSLSDAFYILTHLLSRTRQLPLYLSNVSQLSNFVLLNAPYWQWIIHLAAIVIVEYVDAVQSNTATLLPQNLPTPIRWSLYYLLVLSILFLGTFGTSQFLYVQF